MSLKVDDLIHLPHVVILRSDDRVQVIEFDEGLQAHQFASSQVGSQWGEVLVACRYRRLSSYAYETRAETN